MKKKLTFFIGFIVLILLLIVLLKDVSFNSSDEIKKLLDEKYRENFKIIHDSGNEYKSGLLPTFKKTGYKNVIAMLKDNEDIKFNVRVKINPLEIVEDGYVAAKIACNTSKKIENNYKIGNKIYVHTSAEDYKCDGKMTDSFFDSIDGNGSVVISIYVEGLNNKFNGKDYLNKIINDLKFDSNQNSKIRLYLIKENGIEKIKNYYKNSKDLVKVENSDGIIKKNYFEKINKNNFIIF